MRRDEYLAKKARNSQRLTPAGLKKLEEVWRKLGYDPNLFLDEHNNFTWGETVKNDSFLTGCSYCHELRGEAMADYCNKVIKHMAIYGDVSLHGFINAKEHRFYTADEVAEFTEPYMRRFVPYMGFTAARRQYRKSKFARIVFPFFGDSRKVWYTEDGIFFFDHWTDEQYDLFNYLMVRTAAKAIYKVVDTFYSYVEMCESKGKTINKNDTFEQYLEDIISCYRLETEPFDLDVDVPLPPPVIYKSVHSHDKESHDFVQRIWTPIEIDSEKESLTIREDLAYSGPVVEAPATDPYNQCPEISLGLYETFAYFPSYPRYIPLKRRMKLTDFYTQDDE